MLRLVLLLTVTLLYLAGCNLMSDLSRAGMEKIIIDRGITGLWYSSDMISREDSFSVTFGNETYRFSKEQMYKGISCTSVMEGLHRFADSNFRLDLKLDNRHLLFTAVQYNLPGKGIQYSIENDNWKYFDSHRTRVHCSGSSFDLTDRKTGLSLALRIGNSNSIFISGCFSFRKSTVLVTDSSVYSILKADPNYNSVLSDYASAHYTRLN